MSVYPWETDRIVSLLRNRFPDAAILLEQPGHREGGTRKILVLPQGIVSHERIDKHSVLRVQGVRHDDARDDVDAMHVDLVEILGDGYWDGDLEPEGEEAQATAQSLVELFQSDGARVMTDRDEVDNEWLVREMGDEPV